MTATPIPIPIRTESIGDGYIYFVGGRQRVGYTTKGATGLTGGWLCITPTHIRLANAFLKAQGMLSTGK